MGCRMFFLPKMFYSLWQTVCRRSDLPVMSTKVVNNVRARSVFRAFGGVFDPIRQRTSHIRPSVLHIVHIICMLQQYHCSSGDHADRGHWHTYMYNCTRRPCGRLAAKVRLNWRMASVASVLYYHVFDRRDWHAHQAGITTAFSKQNKRQTCTVGFIFIPPPSWRCCCLYFLRCHFMILDHGNLNMANCELKRTRIKREFLSIDHLHTDKSHLWSVPL